MSDWGYIDWKPGQPRTEATANQIFDLVAAYEDYLPLTLRQIFYLLIGRDYFAKSEANYRHVIYVAGKMRRTIDSEWSLPWSAITDADVEGMFLPSPGLIINQDSFWDSTLRSAERFWRNDAEGQPCRIIVWTETAGMLSQVRQAVSGLPVAVHSGGGQTGLSLVGELVRLTVEEPDVPVHLIQLGDNDPQGHIIYEALVRDVRAFVAGHGHAGLFTGERLAVTLEQVRPRAQGGLGLTEQPVSRGESQGERTKRERWQAEQIALGGTGDSCQLEAIPPEDLRRILRAACESRLDLGQLEDVLAEQTRDRRALSARVREMRPRD